MVDTSVLVAGIAGFKSRSHAARNPSALLLRDWLDNSSFVWLISEDILTEYKAVLARLGVRRNLIGAVINQLREEAELIEVPFTMDVSPDPADNPFCACAEAGQAAFIVTLNPKDFPQRQLTAKVIPPGGAIPTTRSRRKGSQR